MQLSHLWSSVGLPHAINYLKHKACLALCLFQVLYFCIPAFQRAGCGTVCPSTHFPKSRAGERESKKWKEWKDFSHFWGVWRHSFSAKPQQSEFSIIRKIWFTISFSLCHCFILSLYVLHVWSMRATGSSGPGLPCARGRYCPAGLEEVLCPRGTFTPHQGAISEPISLRRCVWTLPVYHVSISHTQVLILFPLHF